MRARGTAGLLTLYAVILGGCAAVPTIPTKKTGPIKPQVAKTYHYQDFPINFPNNAAGSIISNFAVTVDQDPNDSNRTIWALSFDTYNHNWDTDGGMFQGSLNAYFMTSDNAPVPMPYPNGMLGIASWRDACYYDGQRHKYYQGSFGIPYTDFLSLADHLAVYPIWHRSAIGPC